MKNLERLPLIALTLLLAGCGGTWFGDDEDPPLEGERISVLELQQSIEPDAAAKGAVTVPAPWNNEFWPQNGGYPNHSMQHLDLNPGELKLAWKANIGKGGTKDLPLTAQPIIAEGMVFTLDSESVLRAFSVSSGKLVWDEDLASEDEDESVIGGGVSFSNGVLYATNGFNELIALNPKDGKIIWRKTISSASRAAPAVLEGRVFVTTLDNALLALNAADGSFLWDYRGLNETAGLLGAASAAAGRDIVVPVFSSGEITALRVANGSVAWSDNLANTRRLGGLSNLSDIKGLPVMDRGLVIAVSFSGRLVAIDERTGTRLWQREIGGTQTPWVAGDYIFLLSTDNQLAALERDTGSIRWVMQLTRWEDEKRKKPVVWQGPILAGGRLILAGTDGRVVELSPEDGKLLKQWNAGRTVSVAPVVAGRTLYLLSDDGTLLAYR